MHLSVLGELPDLLLLICLVLGAFYIYSVRYHGVWEKVAIPGPKPWPIIGHALELRGNFPEALDKWRKKYGRTFGIYNFPPGCATLVTTDISLLNHILVKDFTNFADRYNNKVTHSSVLKGLFFVNGGLWKRNRHVMSPMFTGGKMKLMLQHINSSAAGLAKLIQEAKDENELIPLKNVSAKYASDVIAKTGFGVDGIAMTKEDSEFFYNVNRFLGLGSPALKGFRFLLLSCPSFLALCLALFPWILKLFSSIDPVSPESEKYFTNLAESTMDEKKRRKMSDRVSDKARDMLDLLVKAEVEGNQPLNEEDKAMSRQEIIANSTLLIFAAYETTSTCLTVILYSLARYPDIQEKVIEEIDSVLDGRTQPDYELLSQLKYTEQVIYEALRLFPPVSHVIRSTRETKTYDGVTIPQKTTVYIPIYQISHDPEHWPDPWKFDPDRFGPDKKATSDSVSFLPFGIGPRQCVGKRLAMMELKVALCHLLTKMKFIQSEHTEPKAGCDVVLKTPVEIDFVMPEKPIMLDVVYRDR